MTTFASGKRLEVKTVSHMKAVSLNDNLSMPGFAPLFIPVLMWGFFSFRVELQKMKIVRPPADVARYTMVFHKRDSGNQINKDRSVNVVVVVNHKALKLIVSQ